MDSGYLWTVLLFQFAEVSPLIMLVLGALGFLIAIKKSKRVKIVAVAGGVLIPVVLMLGVIDLFFILGTAGEAFGRDFGFNDRFDVPLHNDYHWTSVDSPDNGIVYNIVGTDDGYMGSIPHNQETFWNVLEVQEQGDWVAGSLWGNSSEPIPENWFLFNTRTHQRIDAKNEEELRVATAGKGIQLHLQPCREFYLSRQSRWIAVLQITLLVILPFVGLGLLWKLALKFIAKGQKTNQRPVGVPA